MTDLLLHILAGAGVAWGMLCAWLIHLAGLRNRAALDILLNDQDRAPLGGG
jgi:hypothetical protein